MSYQGSPTLYMYMYAAAAKLLQSCLTLCDPRDGSPPGSPVPGILQARTLKWVAISFSSAWKWKVKVKSLSRVRLLAAPWTAAYQALPSMGFSRQEYWSGVPLSSPIYIYNKIYTCKLCTIHSSLFEISIKIYYVYRKRKVYKIMQIPKWICFNMNKSRLIKYVSVILNI